MPAIAAEDTLVKKATFTANELDFHYDFPEEIEENGQKYSRGFVSYMILDETHETKTVHETDTVAFIVCTGKEGTVWKYFVLLPDCF